MNMSDKYSMYSISFDHGLTRRMIMVHIARPVSFKTVVEQFIMQHLELTVEKTKEGFKTSHICAIQKIPNDNVPLYELTVTGILKEI